MTVRPLDAQGHGVLFLLCLPPSVWQAISSPPLTPLLLPRPVAPLSEYNPPLAPAQTQLLAPLPQFLLSSLRYLSHKPGRKGASLRAVWGWGGAMWTNPAGSLTRRVTGAFTWFQRQLGFYVLTVHPSPQPTFLPRQVPATHTHS